jgi:hypothetical protein
MGVGFSSKVITSQRKKKGGGVEVLNERYDSLDGCVCIQLLVDR